MKKYTKLIDNINKEMLRFGLTMQPPCSPADTRELQNDSIRKLGHATPSQYTEFLLAANGLDWNGLTIYASVRSKISGFPNRFIEGFVEKNLSYRDFNPMKDYLVFADDGNVMFAYYINESKYQISTMVGLTKIETFDSFDELIYEAINSHM